MKCHNVNRLFFIFFLFFIINISNVPTIAKSSMKYSVEVIVIHANNSGKGIDSGLEEIIPTAKPPFSSYDTFKVLQKFKKKLKYKRTVLFFINDGSMLGIKVNDVKSKDSTEFVLSIFYGRKKSREDVQIEEDEIVLVGGQSFEEGRIIYYLKVN